MSSPIIYRCRYYFRTNTFISIVLELELYPISNSFSLPEDLADDIEGADIERWQKLFGLTADEARHFVAAHRGDKKERQYSEETRQKWP
jgi:hypothetical protein